MKLDPGAEPETKTWTWTQVCEAFNEEVMMGCDLVAGHEGAHKAAIFWGDEPLEGDEDAS